MTPRQCIAAYACSAAVFVAMDMVWLGTMASRLYRPALGPLLAEGFSLVPALLFYLLYLLGVLVFAIEPSWDRGGASALARGALFGLVAYATYDLTNQSTLRDWPWVVTLADLGWGTCVTGVAACAGRAIARWLTA